MIDRLLQFNLAREEDHFGGKPFKKRMCVHKSVEAIQGDKSRALQG